MERAVASWMGENKEKVSNSSLEVTEIDEQGLEVQVQGRYKLRVIVPPDLLNEDEDLDPDYFFIAYSPENQNSEEFDKKIKSLNDKFQNVKISLRRRALEIVLDHIVNAFAVQGQGKLKELDKKVEKIAATSGADSGLLKAVLKEFKNLSRASAESGAAQDEFIRNIAVEIPDESDICKWHVRMHMNMFRGSKELYKDLEKYCKARKIKGEEACVLLEVTFPKDYPFAPPFVRVVRPKFRFHTGHVTVGGSVCTEVLTPSGWLPSFSMENVLVQVHHAILEGGGRLEVSDTLDYSLEEARSAFTRVARDHGWI